MVYIIFPSVDLLFSDLFLKVTSVMVSQTRKALPATLIILCMLLSAAKVETCGDYFLQTFFTINAVVNFYSCWVVSLRCSHLHSWIYVSLLCSAWNY